MPARRILSLWFPRLGAERLLRRLGLSGADLPFAVVHDTGQMQVITALSLRAGQTGLRRGQPLRDAMALCPDLVTRPQDRPAEAAFLTTLRRWCGQFSPLVAEDPPEGLMLDITGCAHLFGGETALLARITDDCGHHGLSLRAGLADTPGAAWALARHAGTAPEAARNGDAVDQEARATRSRAARRRHWERGGALPVTGPTSATDQGQRIAAPGQTHGALASLPVAALRLDPDTVEALTRLGLRRIGDLTGQPRAPLARRFGTGLLMRLDQALGAAPEPISPARQDTRLATRLNLPDPIGLMTDVAAASDRLLDRLCEMLTVRGLGTRQVLLQAFRCDGTLAEIRLGLAVPLRDPARIRPLLALKLADIDAGHGIDALRIEALQSELIHARQHAGHAEAAISQTRHNHGPAGLEDLIARMGTRIGLDAITRRHPADSHLPEKSALVLAAAWSEPAPDWPRRAPPRPLLLWPPEPVTATDRPTPPRSFRWRRRDFNAAGARGPERIAPEWWLDDPAWRSGTRDYWDVTTGCGARLWLFYAHGSRQPGGQTGGWFCHGSFA